MKTLILYSGNLGSTAKAAQYLADKLTDAEVMDTAAEPLPNFNKYDCVVFGTNVRMFRLNKRFVKYAKSWVKARTGKPVYAFVVGADEPKIEKQIKKADKKLKCHGASIYVGGELNEAGASKFERSIIEGVLEAFKKESKPLPTLRYGALRELAEKIENT